MNDAGGKHDAVWSAQDTTPDQIDDALRRMLRQLHSENQSLVPARVLNLVVVVDREWKGEIANRLGKVGRYHASRTVLCAIEDRRTTIDATAAISYEATRDGAGVMLEQVEIDVGPTQLERLDTVIDPVIISELPTVLWSPHGYDDVARTVAKLIDVVLLDSDDEPDLAGGLTKACELLQSAYVVDLAWLRTTPWRERLASSFDPPWRRRELGRLCEFTVRHREDSRSSALLLAGWLGSRLGFDVPGELVTGDGGSMSGALGANGSQFTVNLESVDQDAPGLAGVTVTAEDGFSLSLDRGAGGLTAKEVRDGDERTWQVLGASRGEGGILGEGVRQAHLRDPTYGPALDAARALCPT